MRAVDLIIMSGAGGQSPVESMVDGARRAVASDLVGKALAGGAFARIVVSTNDAVLAELCAGRPGVWVEPDPEGEPFHFGRRMQSLVAKYGMQRVVYLGGGSAPLLPVSTLCEMAERVRDADRLFLANNFYSVDFCAFTPADELLSLPPPANDNSLGWLLSETAGLPAHELARSAATVFDVDTAIDLVTLSLHPEVPPYTRRYLDGLKLDTQTVSAASAFFVDRNAEVLICGRVSSTTLSHLERESACRTRVLSEERGMRADGRLARGEVRSLLGMLVETTGVEHLFQHVVPELGRAAFIDDRVVWAHCRVWSSANDRFNSDLYRSAEISDPFVRRWTEAAAACPVPVVLGGHSLVSGGLYVLVEAAWARSGTDLQRPVEVP
jgi:hypothetical protein